MGPAGPGCPITLPKESRTGPGGPGGPGGPIGPGNPENCERKSACSEQLKVLSYLANSIKRCNTTLGRGH